MDPATSACACDPDLDHDTWWHEDDRLHQAEGVLSVQLAVSVAESSALLRAYSEKTGIAPDTIASQVVRHQVFLAGRRRGPDASSPPPRVDPPEASVHSPTSSETGMA